MHAAHEVKGPQFALAILTTKELLDLLPTEQGWNFNGTSKFTNKEEQDEYIYYRKRKVTIHLVKEALPRPSHEEFNLWNITEKGLQEISSQDPMQP